MNTNEHQDDQQNLSRRKAMLRGIQGAAGVAVTGSLASHVFAAGAGESPEATLAELKAARDAAAKQKVGDATKIKSVIQVFLWGGMSHNDTWDPKPKAGYDYTGEFNKVVDTNVKGIQLGALFPALAKQADKFSLIRSMTHGNNGHETAAYLMQTGHKPGGRLSYPSVGAIFTYFKKKQYKGLLPPYIVMLKAAGRFSEEGFLGPAYKPFATGGDPNAERFEVQGIINRGINDSRQNARRELIDKLNVMGYGLADTPQVIASEKAKEKAYGLILGRTRRTQGPLRSQYLRPGMPRRPPHGRGRRALRHHQLPRRLGHPQGPLRDHEATVPDVGPGPGVPARGLEAKGPARQHTGVVHR